MLDNNVNKYPYYNQQFQAVRSNTGQPQVPMEAQIDPELLKENYEDYMNVLEGRTVI